MTLFDASDLTTVSTINVPRHIEFGDILTDAGKADRWLISERQTRFINTDEMQISVRPVIREPAVRRNEPALIGFVKLGPAGSIYVAGVQLTTRDLS